MHPAFSENKNQAAISIYPITALRLESWLSQQPRHIQQWAKTSQFKADSGQFCMVPKQDGHLECVLLGLADENDFWAFGALPSKLPEGCFTIEESELLKNADQYQLAALAWGLGFYQFSQYKSEVQPRLAKLVLPKRVDQSSLEKFLAAIELTRNLINTPAEDMGPDALETAVLTVAKKFGASASVIKGEKILKEKYPAIHAVGRASTREPRVIDLKWGKNKNAPKITLVGKGVCFDSGGLDLKTASGMLLMKKDMAGSAMMLSLAQLIMSHELPVQLRLLVGAVENSVAGNAYRPGDIIKTRAGKTIEVTNTDAEGRMVLCDLLFEACSEKPDVVIDFATLTGAARVALGEDLPALYAQPQSFADDLLKASRNVNDPIWQMPLVSQYKEKLKSEIADMVNAADSPYGGSITAALFLQAFVTPETKWAHVDVAAWNFKPKPGRPVGGDAFGVRAMFEYVKNQVVFK